MHLNMQKILQIDPADLEIQLIQEFHSLIGPENLSLFLTV